MKKQINIALIIIVLSLWGTVLYKYVSQYLLKKEFSAINKEYTAFPDTKIRQKDTFQLAELPRDPFLNKSLIARPIEAIVKKRIPLLSKKGKEPKKEVIFPAIDYYGYIKSTDQKDELVLLKVDGKLLRLKGHQAVEGLKVLNIYKDSIQISFNKKVHYLKKH